MIKSTPANINDYLQESTELLDTVTKNNIRSNQELAAFCMKFNQELNKFQDYLESAGDLDSLLFGSNVEHLRISYSFVKVSYEVVRLISKNPAEFVESAQDLKQQFTIRALELARYGNTSSSVVEAASYSTLALLFQNCFK